MQSPGQPLANVACCIRDGPARRRVGSLLRSHAVRVIDVSWNEVAGLDDIPLWHALVYDLNPWDDRALRSVQHLSSIAPATPVLLYVPFIPGVEALLEQCVEGGRLLLKLQFGDAGESGRLKRELERLRRAVPCEELLFHLRSALPAIPSRPWLFIEEGVRLMARRPAALHNNPRDVAQTMGISMRTLERAFQETSLPHPSETLNWLFLMYVTLLAERSGWSPAAVARAFDRPPNEVYRLRHRLLGRTMGEQSRLRADPRTFEPVLMAFLERCGAGQAGDSRPRRWGGQPRKSPAVTPSRSSIEGSSGFSCG